MVDQREDFLGTENRLVGNGPDYGLCATTRVIPFSRVSAFFASAASAARFRKLAPKFPTKFSAKLAPILAGLFETSVA